MNIQNTLRAAIFTSLMVTSCFTNADQNSKTVDVNVDVDDSQGKVIIMQDIDGEKTTTEEFFELDSSSDIDAKIKDILSEHGIDQGPNSETHTVTKIMSDNNHNNKMVWLQKSDNVNVNLDNGQATVIIKKDNNGEVETIKQTMDVDANTDIDALVDQIMQEHGIEAGDAEVHRKVIKLDKHLTKISSDKPRMGFMANVQDNGWEIISVVPDSGAAEAGMLKGDVVISIDGQSTSNGGLGLKEFISLDKQAGDISKVLVLRDDKEVSLDVAAKVINSPDIIMTMDGLNKGLTLSADKVHVRVEDLSEMMKDLDVNVEHIDKVIKDFSNPEIHVVTTSDADAYFFSGSKMNQWLGKNHHFSTVTEALGKYFGTSQGVLVLEVDTNNKLGLKDGDVIQAINGEDVSSPKDVVKIMSGFKSDESFEIEIIRQKETIYLES